jgi:hypothetical protein
MLPDREPGRRQDRYAVEEVDVDAMIRLIHPKEG